MWVHVQSAAGHHLLDAGLYILWRERSYQKVSQMKSTFVLETNVQGLANNKIKF